MAITLRDMHAVSPIPNGIERLKAAILTGGVFSSPLVARDYHVGAWDSVVMLNRAAERQLLRLDGEAWGSTALFLPSRSSQQWGAREVAELVAVTRAAISGVYHLLERAYPTYQRGRRLREQSRGIHDNLLRAFSTLLRAGVLPLTTGCSGYNHEGMVLLMGECFVEESVFVEFLRAPILDRIDP